MRSLAFLAFGLVLAACGRDEMSRPASLQHDQFHNDPVVVEFHIADGTGKSPWNTKDTAVIMKVGQVLRIFNDDKINHQLHTNGAPFGHGNLIKPGTSVDSLTKYVFNPKNPSEEIYDHIVGPSATFYIRVEPATTE